MGGVHIISASAGSGKTTRLATLLEQELSGGTVRAEAVLATTFTTKAAAELSERVRQRLLEKGHVEQAQRLAGARLGTVNGVCGQLVSDFAFSLGLSPRLQVLDEELAERTLRRCLGGVLEGPRIEELEALTTRLNEFDWRDSVHRVLQSARSNGLDAAGLAASAQRSADGYAALFGDPMPPEAGEALDGALRAGLEEALALVDLSVDATKVTAKGMARVREALATLKAGRPLPWSEWLALTTEAVGKKSEPHLQRLRAAALKHDVHPRLHADVRRAITLVFEVAGEALAAYQDEKRQWGALDFVDQEVLALRLLDVPEVREELQASLDLVLVDEFQDTSPLQLAIFLKLSELVPRSIWVGDQKQAIYSFRGADPALMDAAVAQLLGGVEPETLDQSWRSRPALVDLTSALFAPPFDASGIPAARVRLRPGLRGEPSGLGAVLEHWNLDSKNKEADMGGVAAGVRALIDDPDLRVRDARTQETRPLVAGDVAILCRANDTCAELALALEAQGLRVSIPRAGVVGTLEGQVALAALRLFIDERDSLAAAELARVLHHAEDADGFLGKVLEAPRAASFEAYPFFAALRSARERLPVAGAVAAFDAVVEAVQLQELCRSFGDATLRLANLDRLRAHGLTYVSACLSEGRGATPAGLVAHLEQLAADARDAQASEDGPHAVKVSTWHAAKGLEWPVVVLYDLRSPFGGDARGVRAVGTKGSVDIHAPLADRWVRYWPEPYNRAQTKAPFHERLADCAETLATQQAEAAEALRLLYVGWTRARDRVVLATRGGDLDVARLGLLKTVLTPVEQGIVEWAGVRAPALVRELEPQEPQARSRLPGEGPPLREVQAFPAAFAQPSAREARGIAGAAEDLGARVALSGRPEAELLGQAVHGFLAADREELDDAARLSLAEGQLARWGVAGALRPEDVVAMGARLRTWVARAWPGARWRREWPISQVQADGSLLRGIADLVLEVEGGLVLVDHKSHPGGEAQARDQAEGYAGQLAAYAGALEAATGRRVLGCYIHLPVGGFMVPVELPAQVRAAG